MRPARRVFLEEAAITIGLLTGALYFYYLTAAWGLADYFEPGPFRDYVTGPAIHLELLLTGIGFGALMAVVNAWSESSTLRGRPFGVIILAKSGLYVVCLLVVVGLVWLAFHLFVFSPDEMRAVVGLMSFRLASSVFGALIFGIVAVNFLLEVRRKVGPGNLAALLTGRYHRPRNEHRVFLFLDLKGSTTIAERLGHERYSQFLRQCFHDLTRIVLQSGAQIYQYVGDEVVLTWPAKERSDGTQCVDAFFAFQQALTDKSDWYLGQFGASPEFRGGIEMGPVTATEVGDIKRDIAYHGDPLNTAARLLELCKDFHCNVLVSERIQQAISDAPAFHTEWHGDVTLRGKTEAVSVFEVALSN